MVDGVKNSLVIVRLYLPRSLETERAMMKNFYTWLGANHQDLFAHGPIVHPVSCRLSVGCFNGGNRSWAGQSDKPTRRLWPLSHCSEEMSSC